MILLLNGAFGIGKTTVARALVARVPNSLLFNPEPVGVALQRAARLVGRSVDDFQDLSVWRKLTVAGLRLARLRSANIIVPMGFSNTLYLEELRRAVGRFEPKCLHYCLVAPVDIVHARLHGRGADRDKDAWQYRRASECCAVHGNKVFEKHVDASRRTPEEVAEYISDSIRDRAPTNKYWN